jgi:ketosteroid isomerase-like protein
MSSTFDERVTIARDLLDGIGDLDFDRVAHHLAEDAVMELPFVDEVPPTRGRSAIVDQLRNSVPAMFERMNFTYDEFYDVRGADAVVAEYHSECPQRGSCKIYRNTYITVFRFDGDKIALYKEYLNLLKFIGFTDSVQGA